MNYEINVSKNGQHYFATDERSITDKQKALKLFEEFQRKFPTEEGFTVVVSRWQKSGKYLTDEFNSELLQEAIDRIPK